MTGGYNITPLDDWIKRKIGLRPESDLTTEDLERYQADHLRKTLRYARVNSPFYRDRLTQLPDDFPHRLDDFAAVPFTTAADVRERNLDMLCVPQGDISRVITLQTSGSTAPPKRLYFTEHDLELTIDFFHHGMKTLVRPGSRVLIFMPGPVPGSIGDLLKKALARMDVQSLVHGPVADPCLAIDGIINFGADCLVGLPVQMMNLSRHPRGRDIPEGLIKSVLLSADYVPRAIVEEIENQLRAPVFEHYGMTETGYGGGVECEARNGCHLREADLFFEIVDPTTGRPVTPGESGEIAVTTLTRRGMPLIRYRTGDLARFLVEPCPCGSCLRLLGKVTGRITGIINFRNGGSLNLPDMDEVLFKIPGVLNYEAELTSRDGRDHLIIDVYTDEKNPRIVSGNVQEKVMRIPAVANAVTNGGLTMELKSGIAFEPPANTSIKRILKDKRMENEEPC